MDSIRLYEIEKVSDELVLILGTTYINPISCLSDIDEDLANTEFNGKVLFDLLLANGYSSNRFIEAHTEGHKVDRSSMRVLCASSLDDSILNKIHCFYKSRPWLFEANQILLEEEKSRLICS
jgi:hypothetical protein